ncbi:MAG: DUF3093 domain-containing protein [Catenulispora sp.]|nr:DUF3093 domain-containing protein [Catenulispora sp.]
MEGKDSTTYEERLTAPATWWAVVALTGVMAGLIFLRASPLAALLATIATAALAAALVVAYGRVGVRIHDGYLEAGPARLPLTALGAATALDAEAARRLRTTEADARAFMLLRGYVPTAVRVEVADPTDPTPYLYVSTRRPEKVVAVLERG